MTLYGVLLLNDHPLYCLAIGHAIVLVTHYEVVPFGPESLEGVDAVAVDVGTEAAAHAPRAPCAPLVDVRQLQSSISDVCPHVFVSPYCKWKT